jgi:hypothetical protein
MTIASSEYIAKKVDGSLVSLNIRIGFPELDPASNGADYRCKVEIPSLSFCEYSHGVDAVQSLCLVVQCLKYALEPLISEGYKFYFPQDLERELDLLSALLPTNS